MATCPNCHTRDGVTVEDTGRFQVAMNWKRTALAGVQMKFPAFPLVILRHVCGWSQLCVAAPDGFYAIREEET